eukprot:c5676_g1_i1.p1 GENE.c5676_g1_i1~~c5676_g1_i1.p1  ORF type:complete len:268 (-),score=69.29 c5676_g1_i1:25-828(-)
MLVLSVVFYALAGVGLVTVLAALYALFLLTTNHLKLGWAFRELLHAKVYHSFVPKEAQVLEQVLTKAKRNDPQSALDVIDQFCWKRPCMNLGDVKGKICVAEVKKANPKLMVELGSYIGYSACLFASALQDGAVLHAVDPNPLSYAIRNALTDFCGLNKKVIHELDYSDKFLCRLAAAGKKIDVLFVDHIKPLYLRDVKLTLDLGLLRKGSVIIVDNVLTPGAPDFKAWAISRNGKDFNVEIHSTFLEYSKIKDEVFVLTYLGAENK